MSEVVQLIAEPRTGVGKGPNRRLRAQGRVPAIVYGGTGEPVMLSLEAKEVRRQLTTNPRFFASVIEIQLGKAKLRAIAREAQTHPVTDEALHLDFLRAAKGASVAVEVPVTFLNEDVSVGLKRGGVLNIVRRELELNCPIEAIPETIEVDLAKYDIGDSIHISHVTLPKGVTATITDRDFTICSIATPSGGVKAEAEGEEADAEGEAEG